MPPRSCFDVDTYSDIDLDSTSCSNDTTFAAAPSTSALTPIVESDAASSSSSSSSSSRRSVSFSTTIVETVETVLHISDYTPNEINDCWFSRDEFNLMKEQVQECVKLLENNSTTTSSTTECTRGLEWRTKSGSKRHRRTKMAARDALIVEQEFMREDDGGIDADSLAQLYSSMTKKSLDEARTRGLQDAIDAVQC